MDNSLKYYKTLKICYSADFYNLSAFSLSLSISCHKNKKSIQILTIQKYLKYKKINRKKNYWNY